MSTPDPKSLEDLERVVCAAHAGAVKCESGALDHALKAGEALLDILHRKLVRHGDRENLFIRTCGSKRTGQVYAQLAEHRTVIDEAKAQRSARLSIADALRLIRKPKPKNSSNPDKLPKSLAHWTNDELAVALDALGPDKLMAAMSPAMRTQLKLRLAGQIDRLIARAAHKNPKLEARDLPSFKVVGGKDLLH